MVSFVDNIKFLIVSSSFFTITLSATAGLAFGLTSFKKASNSFKAGVKTFFASWLGGLFGGNLGLIFGYTVGIFLAGKPGS